MLTKIFTMIIFLLMSSVANAHGPTGHRHIQQHVQCDERFIHIPGQYDTWDSVLGLDGEYHFPNPHHQTCCSPACFYSTSPPC
jgi:hypothetical protein